MKDVIVLGGLNMDLIVETPRLAGPGETAEGTRFYTTPGGKGGIKQLRRHGLRKARAQ
ncbi:MAG: hypothetical protein CM1200mP39_17020 [Dehalococcoidia bacterium]|nr:MAG: hypothetical protein CM1200mP39_17020 [Dehalococcoidia bacterium]